MKHNFLFLPAKQVWLAVVLLHHTVPIFYQWGFQAGVEAANYLKSNTALIPKPELVQVRQYVFNSKAAARFNLVAPNGFIVINTP